MKKILIIFGIICVAIECFSQSAEIVWTVEKQKTIKNPRITVQPKKLTWGNEVFALAAEREKNNAFQKNEASDIPKVMPEPKKYYEGSEITIWKKSFEIKDLLPGGEWSNIASHSHAQLKWCDGVKGVVIENRVYVPIFFNGEKDIAVITL